MERGDGGGALGDFARVFEIHAELGVGRGRRRSPRPDRPGRGAAEAHLHIESRAAAEAAVAAAGTTGDATAWVEAQVRVAEAALALGDVDAAMAVSGAAHERAGEVAPAYAAVARYTLVRARLAAVGAEAELVTELAEVAAELWAAGRAPIADEAVLTAAALALDLGDHARAAALSAPLAGPADPAWPAADRLRHAHAVAVHRLAGGDRAGALAAAPPVCGCSIATEPRSAPPSCGSTPPPPANGWPRWASRSPSTAAMRGASWPGPSGREPPPSGWTRHAAPPTPSWPPTSPASAVSATMTTASGAGWNDGSPSASAGPAGRRPPRWPPPRPRSLPPWAPGC